MKAKGYYIAMMTLLFLGTITFISCDKDKEIPLTKTNGTSNRIDIITDSVKSVLYHDAKAFGSVGTFNNITFTQYGHCWDTLEIPMIEKSKSIFENLVSQSKFTSILTNLKANKKYYVRGYAKSSSLTIYGQISNFTTKALEPPTLTSDSTANLTSSSATVWGTIKLDGGTTITARGVCWGTTANPTLTGQHAESNVQANSFSTSITGLTRKTLFHSRVYATNTSGTAYGNDIAFTTLAELPIISTTDASNITAYTATSGGNITSDGSDAITERGVCWSLSQNPTLTDTHSSDGTGSGIFNSSITGLLPGKTYYVKAYATNSIGTAYGNQVSFTTSAVVPTVTTIEITNITAISATCGGSVTDDGGAAIIERGVCWSTTQNPTINDSKTTNETGLGIFSSSITGLNYGTTYYVRAYAVNSIGTSYGYQISFTTKEVVIDIDGNEYNTVTIGTQVWLVENLKTTKFSDGTVIPNVTENVTWTGLSYSAYCWYNNDVNSYKNTFGALYNYFAVVDNRKLCPIGWHVPSESEWLTLEVFLGGNPFAGGKLKSVIFWNSPNTGANNSSGFTGHPGGARFNQTGQYESMGNGGVWWSTTENGSLDAWYRSLEYNNSDLSKGSHGKNNGYSVRCVKD
ncbi:MAG: FISUMP domain-containing protein [Tenuifilaceae bacterium]